MDKNIDPNENKPSVNGGKNINWKKDIMPHIQKRLNLWASMQILPTLRTLFYYLVSINVLENLPERYDYLSRFTARAREKSEICVEERFHKNGNNYAYQFRSDEILPIDCFADNVRRILDINDTYETAEQFYDKGVQYFVKDIAINYKVPRWHNQPHYVEVWVEKDAMVASLNSIINTLGKREVRIVPTRGQESVTYAWQHVMRLKRKQLEGKIIHIRYFGDLDPSGEAIEKELINKLTVDPYKLRNIDFKRVAVTDDQRTKFGLIPNEDPKVIAKLKKDPNRKEFMAKYNLTEDQLFSIEVDALAAMEDPKPLTDLVLESIDEFFDENIYKGNLNNRQITPTKEDLKKLAISKTSDLLASLQSEKGENDG